MPADETVLAILSPAKMSKTWRTGKMNCASVLGARLVSREKTGAEREILAGKKRAQRCLSTAIE